MKLNKYLVILFSCSIVFLVNFAEANNTSKSMIDCFDQSWKYGNWQPLTKDVNEIEYFIGSTSDNKTLCISLCKICHSTRIIDAENKLQRILLSFEGNKILCKHKWSSGFTYQSMDILKNNDLLLLCIKKSIYIAELVDVNCLKDNVYYKVSSPIDREKINGKIDIKEIKWTYKEAKNSIHIGDRQIGIYLRINENANEQKGYVVFTYDYFYGYLGETNINMENCTLIAIAHKKELINNILDLSEFHFKGWEDGLGNLCKNIKVKCLID